MSKRTARSAGKPVDLLADLIAGGQQELARRRAVNRERAEASRAMARETGGLAPRNETWTPLAVRHECTVQLCRCGRQTGFFESGACLVEALGTSDRIRPLSRLGAALHATLPVEHVDVIQTIDTCRACAGSGALAPEELDTAIADAARAHSARHAAQSAATPQEAT